MIALLIRNDGESRVLKYVVLLMISPLLLAQLCAPPDPDGGLKGDGDRGRELFENGDGTNARCTTCHCVDASGGCRLGAPNIQGEELLDIDRRTRSSDVPHSGGKFQFNDQDIADIAAYLQSLGG
jgi:mono/diheme cytochrome c family protein